MARAHETRRPGRVAGVGLLLALLALAGCASRGEVVAPDRVQRLGDDGLVALVPIESAAEGGNDHPVEIEPETLRRVLQTVAIVPADEPGLLERVFDTAEPRDETEARPLFTDAALNRLAPALADALADARADQDIVASIKQSRSDALGGIIRLRSTTTARLFLRDGRLHLIPGVVDRGARATAPENLGDQRPLGHAPVRMDAATVIPAGSRRAAARLDVRPVSDLATGAVPDGRDDWLALSLDVPAEAPAAASTGDPTRTGRPADARRSGQPSAPRGAAGPARAPEAGVDVETVRRVETLRELRERELIDEDTYQDLLREVLDEAFRR